MIRIISFLICLGIFSSCATKPKKISVSTLSEDQEEDEQEDSNSAEISGLSANTRTLTYSFGNNPLSSKRVKLSAVRSISSSLASRLRNPTSKQKNELVTLMALKRLEGQSYASIVNIARKLILNELRVDIARKIPDSAKLELALSAISKRNFSMADHWLNEVAKSKDSRIRASALTGKGMIELLSNRLPEAIYYWNLALKSYDRFAPARLNIAFYALKYGDFQTAKSMLSNMRDDWYALTGLLQAERLGGNPKRTESLCAQVREIKKKYKPALFSCALNTLQGLGDAQKARKQLEEVAQIEGPPSSIDEKAFVIIGKMEQVKAKEQ